VRARYVATLDEIQARYEEWEITGSPEVRMPIGEDFHPFRDRTLVPRPPQGIDVNAQLLEPTAIDTREAWFVRIFLRRYVTWCARRRRFAAMSGAARLARALP
jgi:hypothetical protein